MSIFSGKITISQASKKLENLLGVILKFNDNVRPRSNADKKKKAMLTKNN